MNITIGRYPCPTEEQRQANPETGWPADIWESWVEDEARTWIMYLSPDGEPLIWLRRYPEGGVHGPPITRELIDALYERFGQEAMQEVIEQVRFGQADPTG